VSGPKKAIKEAKPIAASTSRPVRKIKSLRTRQRKLPGTLDRNAAYGT
jgi:hypothetical protein